MYKLYFSPSACSLATNTILNLIGKQPELIYVSSVNNFEEINPSKMVPALQDGDDVLTEGAAIILYLLTKHENDLLPQEPQKRQQVIENMMMANASVHPAYGRLFFANAHMKDGPQKDAFFQAATDAINALWHTIESKFEDGPYLSGDKISPADILLCVYSHWGEFFPVDINIGPKTQRMIDLVRGSDAFRLAQNREREEQRKYEA